MQTTTSTVPPGFMRMAGGRIVPISKPGSAINAKAKKLLIAVQFYEADRDAAEELAVLIADLERTRNHEADILLVNRADSRELSAPTQAKLAAKFDKVALHRCRRTDAKGYPHAPNQMWADLLMLMCQPPFRDDYYALLNMETDAVPMRPGWIAELAEEWKKAAAAAKHVVGFIHNDPVPHVNGLALWHQNILRIVGQNYLSGSSPTVCYDVWHSKRIMPYAKPTNLIHFEYRKATITPAELFAERNGAVPAVFHGVKDGTARAAVKARYITFTDRVAVAAPVPAAPASLVSLTPSPQTAIPSETAAFVAPAAPEPQETPTVPPFASSEPTPSNEAPKGRRQKVFTYFQKAGRPSNEETAIIEAWKKGWKSRGWNPVVLGLRDAAQSTKYDQLSVTLERLPCVTNRVAQAASFNRWLALYVNGGGLLVDMDVLPGDFTPDTSNFTGADVVTSESGRWVGAYLTRENAETLVQGLISYDAQPDDMLAGQPHVTDECVVKRLMSPSPKVWRVVSFDNLTVNQRKSAEMERFLSERPEPMPTVPTAVESATTFPESQIVSTSTTEGELSRQGTP